MYTKFYKNRWEPFPRFRYNMYTRIAHSNVIKNNLSIEVVDVSMSVDLLTFKGYLNKTFVYENSFNGNKFVT